LEKKEKEQAKNEVKHKKRLLQGHPQRKKKKKTKGRKYDRDASSRKGPNLGRERGGENTKAGWRGKTVFRPTRTPRLVERQKNRGTAGSVSPKGSLYKKTGQRARVGHLRQRIAHYSKGKAV